MAVIDEFYSSQRPQGRSLLTGWLGAFLDERAGMNRQLLAQRLKESGKDDAELLEMETRLRVQAATLSKARGEAMAGRKKEANDLLMTLVEADAKMTAALTNAEATVTAAKIGGRSRLQEKSMEIEAENRRKSEYSTGAAKRMAEYVAKWDPNNPTAAHGKSAVASADGKGTPAFDAFVRDMQAIAADEKMSETDPAYLALMRDANNYALKLGRQDLAAGLSATLTDSPDAAQAYQDRVVGRGDADTRRRMNEATAGGVSRSPTQALLQSEIDRRFESGDLGGATTTEESSSRRTSGPEGDTSGRAPARGYDIKGNPALVGRIGRVLVDPNATPDDLAASFDQGLGDINDQIANIEAARKEARAPVFTGANYLLDNPNQVVDPNVIKRLERAGRRAPEVNDELGSYLAGRTPKQAAVAMARDEFDPDRPATELDPLAMSKGGDAQVYLYVADVIANGGADSEKDRRLLVAQVPPSMRDTVDRLLDPKRSDPKQAEATLRRLAEQDPVTFREAYQHDIALAAKHPDRAPALVAGLDALAGDETMGPWATHALEQVDRVAKGKSTREQALSALGRLADAMVEGGKARAKPDEPPGPPPDPKEAREIRETSARNMEMIEARDRAAREDALARKAARQAYREWREDGVDDAAIDAKIAAIKDDKPYSRAFKDELRAQSGRLAKPVSDDVLRAVTSSPLGDADKRPNPRVIHDYWATTPTKRRLDAERREEASAAASQAAIDAEEPLPSSWGSSPDERRAYYDRAMKAAEASGDTAEVDRLKKARAKAEGTQPDPSTLGAMPASP